MGRNAAAQKSIKESMNLLQEDTAYAFMQRESGGTAVTNRNGYTSTDGTSSLLPALNMIAGVRMEERSFGSYRLNIRGSSVRSPFGVRNVKVYWNNIPLTDPGGNVYFNQLALNSFSAMEIVKSPASSMYGAGTGGVILMNNYIPRQTQGSFAYNGGSYDTHNLFASGSFNRKKLSGKLSFAHNQSDGFRQQSSMRRDNISWISNVQLSVTQQLSLSVLYTDMNYQTPGALTLSEYEANERNARPAAGIFPSAVEAKAAIKQRNLTGGITYRNKFSSAVSNSTTVYGAYNSVENSAIRNYERRIEPHWGGRTVFSLNKSWGNGTRLNWHSGAEFQSGNFNIKVSGNKNGTPDTLQTNDDVTISTYSIFSQLAFVTPAGWNYTASVSYNKSKTGFRRLSDEPVLQQPFSFNSEVAPRFVVSKWVAKNIFLSGMIAKGFAPPTVAELLPSTGIINSSLQAEKGWNYEMSLKYRPVDYLKFETTIFHFGIEDAIVQRRDEAGADYFTNAGGTNQNGLELSAGYDYIPKRTRILKQGALNAAYTYSHFKYRSFIKGNDDFSGNAMPGIPKQSLSVVSDMLFRNDIYWTVTYYGASSIFLNDANSVKATPYHLFSTRLGYKANLSKVRLDFYVGGENLLNEKYSLGNDINAANGRYYNAAPRRNYFAGIAIGFVR